MRNKLESETVLLDEVAKRLAAQLPPGWRMDGPRLRRSSEPNLYWGPAVSQDFESEGVIDAWLELQTGEQRGWLAVEVRSQFEPRDVERLVRAFARRTVDAARVNDAPRPAAGWLLVTHHLSIRAQQLLAEAGWSYADATGNARIVLERPAMFMKLKGSERDPNPIARPLRTLRGPIAGRLMRALADLRPPYGIRELALRASTSAAMTSRVVAMLERDAILQREGRGPITSVNWRALLERWAQEYSFMRSNRVVRFLALRGMNPLLDRLRTTKQPYAITGPLVAERRRTLAPTRLVVAYAADIPALARELELEPAGATANVLLAEPNDPVVFERTWEEDGLRFVALSQAVVDLLTSGDRSPRLAEALIEWMGENENDWRT